MARVQYYLLPGAGPGAGPGVIRQRGANGLTFEYLNRSGQWVEDPRLFGSITGWSSDGADECSLEEAQEAAASRCPYKVIWLEDDNS